MNPFMKSTTQPGAEAMNHKYAFVYVVTGLIVLVFVIFAALSTNLRWIRRMSWIWRK